MVKLNEYMTVAAAAAYIGCSADTLRRYDKSNRLRARRNPVTGYRLYLRHELEEFLREMGSVDKKAAAEAKRARKLSEARSRTRTD